MTGVTLIGQQSCVGKCQKLLVKGPWVSMVLTVTAVHVGVTGSNGHSLASGKGIAGHYVIGHVPTWRTDRTGTDKLW